MFINTYTTPAELLACLGDEVTLHEARYMLKILIDGGFQNIETSSIDESKWLEMFETAVRFAEENPET